MRRIHYALLLIIATGPVAAMAQPMSVKDFMRQPEYQQVRISPTGKYLAIVSSLPKNPHEYILATFKTQRLIKGQGKPLNFFKLTNYKMFGPVFWVSDKRIAIETETYVGGFDHPYLTGTLYAMNADGGSTIMLMPLNNRSIFAGLLSILPARENYILVEAYTVGHPTAYLLDTRGGTSLIRGGSNYYFKRAVNPSNGDMAADHNGDVRL
ncbi:MAG: hypothetical protein WCB49_13730, partial [Gammaproteobacteria bacterium]